MNNMKNLFSILSIYFKYNFKKFLAIFIVGFVSRIFINNMYNNNVFLDYFNFIFMFYYIFFSVFIVLVHEFIHYFNFSFSNIIYTSIIEFIGYVVKMFGLLNFRIFSIKLRDIKISSMVKGSNNNNTINSTSLNIFCVSDRNNEIEPQRTVSRSVGRVRGRGAELQRDRRADSLF